MYRGEARPSMDLYSGTIKASRSSRAPPRPAACPLNVPYLTNFPTHDDLFFVGLTWAALFILSHKYSFTACSPRSTTSGGGEASGLPSTLSFCSFLRQPTESGRDLILL